eukprot:TRINITY_DN4192_c0_g1_i2.p1 TRINITY_DN4192_c0_g1~~TRINITY_DN4192_c0_g1_i2.p1  ORF type:complete len:616 (-),score=113.67 TRINITY_DN4192_c0_g1_i2:212-2059(-)
MRRLENLLLKKRLQKVQWTWRKVKAMYLASEDDAAKKEEYETAYRNYVRELILSELPFFVLAALSVLLASTIGINLQLLIGNILDLVKVSSSFTEIQPLILKFAGMVCAETFCTFLYHTLMSIGTERISSKLRQEIFSKILSLDVSYFDEIRTGEVLMRLDSDVTEFRRAMKYIVSDGIKYGTQIVGGAVTLVMLSPHMTIATAITVPILVSIGSLYGKYLRMQSKKMHEAKASTFSVSHERVQNIRTIRAFATESEESEKYNLVDSKEMNASMWFGIYMGGFRGLTFLGVNGLAAALLGYGGTLVTQGQMTAGDLTAYLVTALAFQRSVAQISVLYGKLTNGLAAVSRINGLLMTNPKIPLYGGKKLDKVEGNITFSEISFSYPSRPQNLIFDNLTLDIKSGEVVALVGPSGSGKTTISALLERFYDPDSGYITLDGVNVKDLDPSWYRRQIGIVSQEPVLFHGTIAENIKYARPDASMAEIKAAAEKANCSEFIGAFPAGYDTMIGERGMQLSGGQKQRIAIARAILKDPKILILDEATSALDSVTEALVQSALAKLMENRTVVVIAHRLSTVREADKIVVLSRGKILEQGTHQKLMSQNGKYKSLVQSQMEE